tara:strand:- start:255 stop:752 length:498 start_codon:yes stop_codon:yes gene_type:complete
MKQLLVTILVFLAATVSYATKHYIFEAIATNDSLISSFVYDDADPDDELENYASDRYQVEVTEVQYGAGWAALDPTLKSAAKTAEFAIRNNTASNIVVLAATYGVTDQPISWTDVAVSMQAERADATASNDVMRLLTVIGDGTTMLSYKEFYTENGGDILNVRWP